MRRIHFLVGGRANSALDNYNGFEKMLLICECLAGFNGSSTCLVSIHLS